MCESVSESVCVCVSEVTGDKEADGGNQQKPGDLKKRQG